MHRGILAVIVAAGLISGCSGGAGGAYTASATPTGAPEPPEQGTSTPSATPAPGQLTAADFDDNLNFDFFQQSLADYRQTFASLPTFESSDRVVIRVSDAHGTPLPNAKVTVQQGGATLLATSTGDDGRVLFFPSRDGATGSLSVTVAPPPGRPGTAATTAAPAGQEWDLAVPDSTALLPNEADIAFIVDTTGSMGDELEYVKSEISDIAARISSAFPQVETRFALVLYRDEGDEYVVRTFDFGSLASFQTNVADQSADGGGDWPEALDQAMSAMNQLGWRGGNIARISFLVSDAPAHDEKIGAFLSGVDAARQLGLRVYPIAASGAADDVAYLFRELAEATGARYLFLTDDSGVGAPHSDAGLPCYQVEYLNLLVTRMVASELSGARVEPAQSDIIRRVGDYQGGVCTNIPGQ